MRKGVLGNFAKFTGKHLCHNLFFNKDLLIYRTPPDDYFSKKVAAVELQVNNSSRKLFCLGLS